MLDARAVGISPVDKAELHRMVLLQRHRQITIFQRFGPGIGHAAGIACKRQVVILKGADPHQKGQGRLVDGGADSALAVRQIKVLGHILLL